MATANAQVTPNAFNAAFHATSIAMRDAAAKPR